MKNKNIIPNLCEVKKAFDNGATVQYRHIWEISENSWMDIVNPTWSPDYDYRVKLDSKVKFKPKEGDIRKFWNYDKSKFNIGILVEFDEDSLLYKSTDGCWYVNAEVLTPKKVQKLLFTKEIK